MKKQPIKFQVRPIYKKSLWQGKKRPLPKVTRSARKPIKSILPKTASRQIKIRSWKTIGEAVVAILIIGGLGLIGATAFIIRDLPSASELLNRPIAQSTKILDRDGNLLYEIHGEERRTIVSLTEISDPLKKTTINVEDDQFYQHRGFDIPGILRAVYKNVTSGATLQGGSTITQQLVKNAFLTPQRSISRKVKELVLAMRLETTLTKDQILELYLNTIPYGSNAYGAQEAAKTFFGKNARDIDLAEAAVMASLPKAPTYYSPYGSHKDELLAHQQQVLKKLLDDNQINVEEYVAAKNKEIKFQPYIEKIKAPHFVIWVRELLVERYGEEAVQKGGYKVYTTLDSRMQEAAEKTVKEKVEQNATAYNASNAALVAMNPKNGDILAMVGSKDYFDMEHDGNVNVALRPRQPGSSFKPIVYAQAFLKGYGPASVLWDVQTNFSRGGADYIPHNYDDREHGLVSMRGALARSLNIPAVKTLYLAGLQDTLDLAAKMGITTLDKGADHYGLSLVLGGGEVKLLDMVTAYSVFADQGKKVDPDPFLKIVDGRNQIIYEKKTDPQRTEIFSDGVAYLITSILSDNVARTPTFGASNPLVLPGRPAAAKTGTTNDYRDAWTIGYTPSLVTGVWSGNNDNSSMSRAGGSIAAAPIWQQFMIEALKDQPAESFAPSNKVVSVEVSSLSGKLPSKITPSDKIYKEYFLAGNAPKETEDIFQYTEVDKLSGKLATEFTPDDAIIRYAYLNLKSEMPEFGNWEAPVQRYIANSRDAFSFASTADVKYVASPDEFPKEESTTHSAETMEHAPTIAITSPVNFSSAEPGKIHVDVQIKNTYEIQEVQYFLDDQLAYTNNQSPYRGLIVLPDDRATHTIKAKVLDKLLNAGEDTISIKMPGAGEAQTPADAVAIISPTSGSTFYLDEEIPVSLNIEDENKIEKIAYFWNGNSLFTKEDPPFTANLKPEDQIPGTHSISLDIYDKEGHVAHRNVDIGLAEKRSTAPEINPPTESTISEPSEPAVVQPQPSAAADGNFSADQIGAIDYPVNGAVVGIDQRVAISVRVRSLPQIAQINIVAVNETTGQVINLTQTPVSGYFPSSFAAAFVPNQAGNYQIYFDVIGTDGSSVRAGGNRITAQ